MKKLFYALVIFVFVVFGMGFYINNPQTVELKYYFGLQYELPLAVLLLLCLGVGVLLGYFASLLKSLKLRRNLAHAKREVKNLEAGQIVG